MFGFGVVFACVVFPDLVVFALSASFSIFITRQLTTPARLWILRGTFRLTPELITISKMIVSAIDTREL